MNEIPTRYDPKDVEEKWYRFWEEKGCFAARRDPDKKPFSIVIPPPNVTGILHMGHALNNTIQDILIRYHRMRGEESLWMPGTDHAGIATQNVVEKKIAKEGRRRQELGRDKFLEEVWRWREEYGSTIIRQLKRLGCSCDWERTRFTMDEAYSGAVTKAFISLYEKGLIYRGQYIINWCPRCSTALSDEEAPHHDMDGLLYYIKYPLNDSKEFVVVATTRPETMLGDTAVAVNPKDKRYKQYIGKGLILPLVEREIKVIADKAVDIKFGTGAVKVTPAHDPNDYEIGARHKLEFINVMRPDGKMNEAAGEYRDMDRFEAREAIIEDLRERKLLEKIEPHKHAVGHCYRCHTIVEPYLSRQWFVKMKPLAKPAIAAVKKGEIKFYPKRWTKVYLNWMENIRDWCISRQIWWGHRIPVYYCKNCQGMRKSEIRNPKSETNPKSKTKNPKQNDGIIVSKIKPDKCPVCGGADIYQDEDVLDTWFSSWLWPFATFDNEEDLKYFYPTSVLVTASEIIFFWVARMIMSGYEFMGEKPFSDVYIHGTVRDSTGKKMSKSLGNIIDPLEIIDAFGADALRFSLISLTSMGQDVFLSKDKFESGRNFANKIWNASRFVMMNIDKSVVDTDLCQVYKKEALHPPEKWILSRLYSNLKSCHKALDSYRFNEAANIIYEFFWHEFCDWYLEMAKLTISERNTQIVMYKVLEKSLRMMHPFMPFITEEIWHILHQKAGPIIAQSMPHIQKDLIDHGIEADFKLLFSLITSIRNIRSEMNIDAEQRLSAVAVSEDRGIRSLLSDSAKYISGLARLQSFEIKDSFKPAGAAISDIVGKARIYVLLAGSIDAAKERQRLSSRLSSVEAEIKNKQGRLKNKEFLKKAPKEVIEKEKARLEDLLDTRKKISKILKELSI
ncbi:MAG: valine--tRNA ligase [Candidatus Omnitrophica bacterium]|nr:valine--tRNA ligase [Candidatus Omnitrophota bacterium]